MFLSLGLAAPLGTKAPAITWVTKSFSSCSLSLVQNPYPVRRLQGGFYLPGAQRLLAKGRSQRHDVETELKDHSSSPTSPPAHPPTIGGLRAAS